MWPWELTLISDPESLTMTYVSYDTTLISDPEILTLTYVSYDMTLASIRDKWPWHLASEPHVWILNVQIEVLVVQGVLLEIRKIC